MKKNTQQGFIQIPILVILIVLGTLATATGGYYVVRQNQKIETEKEGIVETTESTSEALGIGLENQQPTEPTSEFSFADKIRTVEPEEELNLDDYKITDEPNTTDKKNTEFKELIVKAGEQIKLLEQDKNNFQLLKETTDDHYQKSTNHARAILSSWANVAEENAITVPSEYRQILLLRRDSIISDQEYVVQYIKSLYEIVGLYFWDSQKGQSKESVIANYQSELNKCIELWTYNEADLSCKVTGLLLFAENEDTNDFIKIAEKLIEVDNLVLETISNHAERAEDNIINDLDRISRIMNSMYVFQIELDRISQQAQYSVSQPVFNIQSVRCYTSTDDHILDPNRTYTTICEPDTRSTAEKCASQTAARLGSEAYIVDSQPDTECE